MKITLIGKDGNVTTVEGAYQEIECTFEKDDYFVSFNARKAQIQTIMFVDNEIGFTVGHKGQNNAL